RCEREKHRNQVQIYGENCRDKKQYTDAAKDNQRFTRSAERPATPNQIPRNATAKKIAQVRSEKGNPDSQKAALERNPFRDQVNGKPIGDEKPNGIGKAFRNDRSPSLGQLQKVAPTQPRLSRRLRLQSLRKNHVSLGIANARVILRKVIHPAPRDQPQEPEQTR